MPRIRWFTVGGVVVLDVRRAGRFSGRAVGVQLPRDGGDGVGGDHDAQGTV
jgi:hypothetical protein